MTGSLLLPTIAILALAGLVLASLAYTNQRRLAREVSELTIEIKRFGGHFQDLERKLDNQWDAVGMKIGQTHEIIETGHACQMGDVVHNLSQEMSKLNKRLEWIIDRLPSPGHRGVEKS